MTWRHLLTHLRNARTAPNRCVAGWLRRQGWVVFYLEEHHRACSSVCWLELYQEGERAAGRGAAVVDVYARGPAPVDAQTKRPAFLALLASFDEWLGNEDNITIEEIIAWRDQLAAALGEPEVGR
jgi:hypothetical protein